MLFIITAFIISYSNAQVYDTVNVTIPGTLNSVAKDYLTTVTNLTVTGSINAQDFKTMRDSMPELAVLNLSNSSIAGYEGTAGTENFGDSDTNSYTYNENSIPQDAFFNQQFIIGKHLTYLTFPANITSIEYEAFRSCSITGYLIIPSSVISIADAAFRGCGGGILTIPSSVTYIGNLAFFNSGFTSIIDLNPVPLNGDAMGSDIFFYNDIKDLYIPYGSIEAYKASSPWGEVNILPIVEISSGSDTVQKGTSVIFKANTGSIGKYLSLQWQVNDKNTGTGADTFSYVPKNRDTVICNAIINGTVIPGNIILMNVVSVSVSTRSLKVFYTSNSHASFTINSNNEWSVISKYCWLTSDITKGSDTTVITLTATANPSINQRTDTVFVSVYGVKSDTVIVTQEAAPAYLTVSKNTLEIAATSDNKGAFSVYSNESWMLTTSKTQTWLTPEFTANSDTSIVIIITATANTTINQRVDTITVSGDGVNSKKVIVTQAAGLATLSISKDSLNIDAVSNSKRTFSIYSNEAWNLTTNQGQTWLTPNVTSGSDSTVITLAYTANTSGTQRTDTVIVSANGVNPDTLIVTQTAGSVTGLADIRSVDVTIYPNPVADNLSISIPNPPAQTSIAIYNIKGIEVYSSNITSVLTEVDMSGYSSGVYIVKIITPFNEIATKKIIKQ